MHPDHSLLTFNSLTMIFPRRNALKLMLLSVILGNWRWMVVAISIHQSTEKQSLKFELQQCVSPQDLLERVASKLTTQTDPDGSIASLVLVRLAKQIIYMDNNAGAGGTQCWRDEILKNEKAWINVCTVLAHSLTLDMNPSLLESSTEGFKAASTISRLLPTSYMLWSPLLTTWNHQPLLYYANLAPHQVTGIMWAYDTFSLHNKDAIAPVSLQERYDELDMPFRIIPACLQKVTDLTVETLINQVDFQIDTIRTTSNQVVKERRQTAWEGDSGVAPFQYSGKSMPTRSWSPLVETVRDCLVKTTGQYYDGCLLNLYPDGGSGMRYHIDPDQGDLWDFATAVVSVGATRRFAFRDIPSDHENNDKNLPASQPHNFFVMGGDVTEMIHDCQSRFQHTVKTADDKNEVAARASLVFKRTMTTK